MARKPTSGVFCVEAAWSPRLTDRTSVLPLLETLERVGAVRSIHDKVHTRDEFLGFVRRWSQRQDDDYKLGYLVGHGPSGTSTSAVGGCLYEELTRSGSTCLPECPRHQRDRGGSRSLLALYLAQGSEF